MTVIRWTTWLRDRAVITVLALTGGGPVCLIRRPPSQGS